MLVTALDVTGEQELAAELEEAKEQLQRCPLKYPPCCEVKRTALD